RKIPARQCSISGPEMITAITPAIAHVRLYAPTCRDICFASRDAEQRLSSIGHVIDVTNMYISKQKLIVICEAIIAAAAQISVMTEKRAASAAGRPNFSDNACAVSEPMM